MSTLKNIRTTVDIPAYLVRKVDKILKENVARSRNEPSIRSNGSFDSLEDRSKDTVLVNDLIVRALEEFLEKYERQKIDEQIAQMANDLEYQKLQLEMIKEYERAGWKAMQLGEQK